MFNNIWNSIIDWFQDTNERNRLIRDFNQAARNAFINQSVPTLLKAKISKGERAYKHQFSNWLKTGFRVQSFSGKQLSKDELKQIGGVILADEILVRKLIVLGWDTLEIHGDKGYFGLKWQLKDYVLLN